MLVAGASKTGRPTYIIGTADQKEGEKILAMVRAGAYWLQERPYQPIRVHRYSNAEGSSKQEAPVIGADKDVPSFDIRLVEGDPQKELEAGTIDLIGSVDALPDASPLSARGSTKPIQNSLPTG